MKSLVISILLAFLLAGCTDNYAEEHRKAVQREIDRQVELRTAAYAERRLGSVRMMVFGSIALVSLIMMCVVRQEPPRAPTNDPIAIFVPVPRRHCPVCSQCSPWTDHRRPRQAS